MSTPNGMAHNAVIRGTELRLDAAIAGLLNAIPAGVTSIVIGTVSTKVTDLVKQATAIERPWKDARAAHAVIRATAQSRPKDEQAALEFLADLKAALTVVLGRDSQDLAKFGFKPQVRRAPLTSDQKVLRAAKAQLTREKRHTMGSRQKADLKQTATPTISIGPEGVSVSAPDQTPAPTPTTGSPTPKPQTPPVTSGTRAA